MALKHPIRLALIAAVTLVLIQSALGGCASQEQVAPTAEVFEPGSIVVDVRTPEEYAEGHIPGAINIPLDTLGDEQPAELPDLDQRIYVYCRSGRRSATATAILAGIGYTDVVDFGGILDWDGEIEY